MTIKAVVFDAYGTLYDIQSVAAVTERAFPGYGEIVTQIWRIKQLEYTWLRSLMRRYEDFSVVTRESLVYTLRILGLKHDSGVLEAIMEKVNNGTGTIGALVNDPGLYDDLKSLVGGAQRNRLLRNLVRQTIKEGEPEQPAKK